MQTIVNVLQNKDLRLPLIVAKNGYETRLAGSRSFLMLGMNEKTRQFHCRLLTQWMTVCETLMLINYTASSEGTGYRSLWLYSAGLTQPAGEAAFLRNVDAGRLDVTIPFVRFVGTQTSAELCQRFISAANNSCPAVAQRTLEKVTAIHARWVQTLDYPGQWVGIRDLFQMFNGTHPDGRPQRWDVVDLRQLDVSVLNQLTFAALDVYYND
ncbi:uncharacterized protein LOC129588981 [Paramacrobiotus metropolitanus]|uniref:uncharacterized protein LOC129588981 n=1 Tax=Paramacrobiotus metropolitanus TaxID=2943436 RepID=UPI002445999D|nr:uncharacterized protein LOC129588981 [Paramacrobiotus metropolitanus]